MKKILFIFCFFVTISIFSQEEKRLALVIGNANYDSIAKLANPVNDAKLIAKTLDSLDFDVILATNLDEDGFMEKIIEFRDKRKNYDVGFVYYAGHGIQIDGENYLLPVNENFDEEWKVKKYAINVNDVMDYLTASTDQVNILILDACRNNPWEGNFRSVVGSNKGGLAKIPAPTGSLIAFSTDAGAVAADGDGENSVYCISLVKNMVLENTTLDQVFRNVRSDVLRESNERQRPIENSQLTGQAFYLVKSDYKNIFSSIEKILDNFNNPYFDETDYKPQLFESLKKLNIILSEDPSNIRALLLSAKIYYQLDQKEKALSITNSVIKINDKYIDAYKFRSNLYGELYFAGELDKAELAEKDDDKVIELDPQDISSYYTIIIRYSREKKYNKLLESVNEALIFHRKDEELYRWKAIGHSYLGQNELALKAYSKAIELDPENGFYYMEKGSFLATDLERHEEAIEMFAKANELKPDEPSPYESMILSYFNINSVEKIVELSEQLITLDINDPAPYYYLSKYYIINRNYSKAITYLSIALFKKIENNGWIRDIDYGIVYLNDLYIERSKLYNQLGIKIFECEDLNNGLNYLKTLENLTEEELKSPKIEFWNDKKFIKKIKLEIESLILENCK